MEIIECGASVAKKFQNGSVKGNTYVCVVNAPHETSLSDAIAEIKAYLGDKVKEFNEDTLTFITLTEDKYTLAHEIIVNKDEISATPSNLLRHIFSRLYTCEGLYIDENEEYVDICKRSLGDINSDFLRPLHKDFKNILRIKPDLLLPIIKIALYSKDCFADIIGDLLYFYSSKFKIKDIDGLKKILTSGNEFKNIEQLSHYIGLMRYLKNMCGLQCNIRFVDPPAILEEEEIPIQSFKYNPEAEEDDNFKLPHRKEPIPKVVVYKPQLVDVLR